MTFFGARGERVLKLEALLRVETASGIALQRRSLRPGLRPT